jgi:hypothetical protein
VKKMACVTAPPALPPAPTKPDTRPVARLDTNGTTPKELRSGVVRAAGLLSVRVGRLHPFQSPAQQGQNPEKTHSPQDCWQQMEKMTRTTMVTVREWEERPRTMQNTPPRVWMVLGSLGGARQGV